MTGNEKTFYVLECGVKGCRAEFWVNDVPVTLRSQKGGTYFGGPVNHLVVDGMNEVSILVEPGPRPSAALSNGGKRARKSMKDASAFAKLVRYPQGAVVGGPDGALLVDASWVSSGEIQTFPAVVTGRGDAGDPFGIWDWQAAGQVKLDPESLNAAAEMLEKLRASLEKGDPGQFLKRSATRVADIERAFGLEKGEKASLIARATVKEAAESWWGMQPIDPKSVEWRLCGGNRMLDVLYPDWKPALREKKDNKGGIGYYDMKLASIGGEWVVAR